MSNIKASLDNGSNFFLFLDIDEVVQVSCAKFDRSTAWPDFQWTDNHQSHIFSPLMVEELNEFIKFHNPTVYIVSTWEEKAAAFTKFIGLKNSENWPWLNATIDLEGQWAKFHSVKTATTALNSVIPAIWIDDDLVDEHEASLWAAENDILAIASSMSHGITKTHFVHMRKYAEKINSIFNT
jgi:hypothetical protein